MNLWYLYSMRRTHHSSLSFLFCIAALCLACDSVDESHTLSGEIDNLDGSIPSQDARAVGGQVSLDARVAFTYPLDDVLRVNHLQALGTHNSYHLQPEVDILPWRYSHLPLDEQLGLQGVRQFELDIFENEDGTLEIYHLAFVDARSTCPDLANCLNVMKAWSDQNLGHHPVLVLLEVKRYRGTAAETVRKIEDILTQTWTRERLLTPALVQRGYDSILAGLSAEGWPSLGEVRGKLLVVLHAGGDLRDAYLAAAGGTEARLMFPDAYGDINTSYAAYHSMNNPIGSQSAIQAVVRAGHLVRTRSDADGEESDTLDYTRANAALASGAHFISTDFPSLATEARYGFVIPEGTPSRCNRLTAPQNCSPAAIENLAGLEPL